MKKTKFAYLINILWSEEDKCYMAEIPELEGCVTHGKTTAEAAKRAEDAIESWLHTAKKLKHPIPEPVLQHPVSGKFNVRLPKELHKSLIVKAAQEKTSLNQMVLSLLVKAL